MQTEIVKSYLFQYRAFQSLYFHVTNLVVIGNTISEPFIARNDFLQGFCLLPTLVKILIDNYDTKWKRKCLKIYIHYLLFSDVQIIVIENEEDN